MKVKCFLRGLGMGIVFSVFLLTAVGPVKKEALTDEEIMTRASLLGMVRADEGLVPEETETPKTTETPEATETPEETEIPELTENSVEAEKPEEIEETVEAVETEKLKSEPEYATLTIRGGMTSKKVAVALENAGIISNAASFDKYLCNNGYASKISVGSFKIEIGADFYEIAEKITK